MIKIGAKYFVFFIITTLFITGCKDEVEPKKKTRITNLKIISPNHNQQYTIGENINIELEVNLPENVKELTIYINDTLYQSNVNSESQTISINTENAFVGFNTIHITYKDQNGKVKGATRNITLFSDLIPEQKIASIQHTFPHQSTSYTQGLEFYNNELYESTGSGDYGKSFIAKVQLESGKHLQSIDLDVKHFGEGITILNDTIYQLTWRTNTCLVYTLDFKFIKSYTYEGEGWGLTNNGKSIIMTNGTSEIVWRNPKTFEIEKRIYAFSNDSDIQNLNELELINGILFCNVYTENYLVEVDTANGKVLSKIDCLGITTESIVGNANVLNGIAYNSITDKIYLTGKFWSNLYEITID